MFHLWRNWTKGVFNTFCWTIIRYKFYKLSVMTLETFHIFPLPEL